jgi:uncharacterized protein YjbI with pentapeptide repeats
MLHRIRHWWFPPKVDLSCVNPRFLRRSYKNVEWSAQELQHFVPVGCLFESCKFEDADMLHTCFGGGLEDSVYVNCSFDRSTITAVAAGNARFTSCSFLNVNIVAFFANSVEMVDCRISGIVREAVFIGTVPKDRAPALKRVKNRFEGNDFSEARLLDVDFRNGIDLRLQKMPAGWKSGA